MDIDKRKLIILLADQRLTQKTLAERIGMKPQNLCGVLNKGRCNPITAARIAFGLGVPVEEIILEVP